MYENEDFHELPPSETPCLDPVTIWNLDVPVLVGCRKCSRCVQNKLTNFSGRAFAEALVSDHVFAVTLTYADSDATNSQVLIYRDIQLLIKRLRDSFEVRYVCAGEYGSKRGRAHWHIVLFFKGDCPKIPPLETQKQMWKFWKHGFSFFQRPDYFGMMYVLKYIQKGSGSQYEYRKPMMSKKPPLGAGYWPILARQRIDAGLPFSREFSLPDAKYANGNTIKFYLSRSSLRLAFKAHRDYWLSQGKRGEPPVLERDRVFLEKDLLGESSSSDQALNGFYAMRDWVLERESHSFRKKAMPCLTFPTGMFYKDGIGRTICVTRSSDGRNFVKWVVPDLESAVAVVRGRAHRRKVVTPPVRLGSNRPPF